jgi:NADH-quinone oxidoreductase subunit J
MYLVIFFIFGALCVGGALNLLLQRHPINSALSLIVVMTSLAVLYLLLGAEFLAAAQVIVYSGAIMVLFTFVIMLLNAGEEERTRGSKAAYLVGFPGAAAPADICFPFSEDAAWRRAAGRLHRHDIRPQQSPFPRSAPTV